MYSSKDNYSACRQEAKSDPDFKIVSIVISSDNKNKNVSKDLDQCSEYQRLVVSKEIWSQFEDWCRRNRPSIFEKTNLSLGFCQMLTQALANEQNLGEQIFVPSQPPDSDFRFTTTKRRKRSKEQELKEGRNKLSSIMGITMFGAALVIIFFIIRATSS